MAKKTADCGTTATAISGKRNTLAPLIKNFNLIPETEYSLQPNSKSPRLDVVPPCLDAPRIPLPVSSKALLISNFLPNGRVIPDGEEEDLEKPVDRDCEMCTQLKRDLQDSDRDHQIERKKLELLNEKEKAEKEKSFYTMKVMIHCTDDNLKELPKRYEEVMELVSYLPSSIQQSKEELAGEIVDAIAKMGHKRSMSWGSRN